MTSEATRRLVAKYLEIVATDDYGQFGDLLTDDCTFSLMPIGRTFTGREDVMAFTSRAGGSRTHDERSKVTITNWFSTDDHLVVEYEHAAVAMGVRVKIDGYCWVFHIRDGKFDVVREYVNPSSIVVSFLVNVVMRILPYAWRLKGRRLR
jgi:ketosteroid isomerase-like protein